MIFGQMAEDRKVRVFSLSPVFLESFKGRQPSWGPLGLFTYKRTYARTKPDGFSEDWWETCQRVVEGCFNIQKIHCRQMGLPWNEPKAQKSSQEMFQRLFDFKWTPPGRGLWMMGTDLVFERGSAALQNCSFISSEGVGEDFSSPFCFLMDMSMLGVGVGGDTRGAGKVKIQVPKTTPEPYEVGDSREGWVDLLRVVLNSFVGKGAFPTIIDYSKVRGRGASLKTFGGTASGPGPLHDMVEGITKVLLPGGVTVKFQVTEGPDKGTIDKVGVQFFGSGEPTRITSTQIVDIFNYVGRCVVAGGVRRSSEIMFGESTDQEFLKLKQDKEALQDRRWASNNSIFGYAGMDYTPLVEAVAVNGEPGVFWIENARKFSRMGYPEDNRDWRVMGTNPCVTGDTLVFTNDGPMRADKLIGRSFHAVVDGTAYPSKNGMYQTGVKPVFLVQTVEGHSIRVTENHRILTAPKVTRKKRYEMWVEAQDLEPGDKVVLNNARPCEDTTGNHPDLGWGSLGTFDEGWLFGNLLGDGTIIEDSALLRYWGPNKHPMLEVALGRIKKLGGDPRYHLTRTGSENESLDVITTRSRRLWEMASDYGISKEKDIFNDVISTASSGFQAGFLRGLFDADGSVQGDQSKGVSIRLSSSTRQHLLIAQKMLMHFGINSTIYWERRGAGEKLLPNGDGGLETYFCQAQHELVISKDNIAVFADRIGFDDPDKTAKLTRLLENYARCLNRERFVATVASVTYVGIEPVFDGTIEGAHRFGANGIIVHNCGEISLESAELCNLVETYPAHHDSYEDFERTLKMAYLYAKTVTLVPTHDMRANAVMTRNRRIGCSMSGIVQAMVKLGRRQFFGWCDGGYQYLQRLDRVYSDWLGIPLSIKVSTVKPSGCQVRGTLVGTSEGLLRLDEIGNVEGAQWQDLQGFRTAEGKDIDKFYINGKVETLRFTTADGNVLEASLQHRYQVYTGSMDVIDPTRVEWRLASDIREGDFFVCVLGSNKKGVESVLKPVPPPYHNVGEISQPNLMSPKLAWFLGLFYGDGSVHEKGIRISFNRKEPSLVRKIADVASELFGISVPPPTGEETGVYLNSTWLITYLKENGICKEFCEDLRVPRAIRCASRESILAFLTGLWRADGGIHNRSTWTVCTVSRDFALELLSLARSVGINLKLTSAGPGGWGSLDRWILSSRDLGDIKKTRYQSRALKNRAFRFGGVLFWLDPVEKIETGKADTFDISVPDGNAYEANGVVSHNTVSLLTGSTPGIHYPHSPFYIRHVRVANTSALVELARRAGHPVHDDPYAPDTSVVAFPVKELHYLKGKREVTVWEQFINAVDMQRRWADNQVSVTITFRPEELTDLKAGLETFEDRLKGVSMLPAKAGDGKSYQYPPYQEIDEATYNDLMSKTTPMALNVSSHDINSEDKFCTGDSCMIG